MNDDRNNSFEKGYRQYFEKGLSDSTCAEITNTKSTEYVGNIAKAIKDLEDNINSYNTASLNDTGVHGDIAETWHEGTFNIDATIKDRSVRAVRLQSNKIGSVDIQVLDNGQIERNVSLKYCGPTKHKDANGGPESAWAQYSPNETGASKFKEQTRVVPKGTVESGKDYLEKEYGDSAQETIDNLTETVTSEDGQVSSEPLSYKGSQRIKKEVVGKDEYKHHIQLSDVKYEYILKKSCKIGLRSAIAAGAISILPQVFQMLVDEGYSFDDFKNMCETGATSSIEGFLQGSISASISISCQLGKFGEVLKNANPEMTAYTAGAITAIAIHTMKNAYLVAMGKKQPRELANEMLSDIFISAGGMVGGALTSFIPIPFAGYFIGSAIGSILASFVYKQVYSATIGLCVEHGYTLWGLVKQDYTVPAEVLKGIGIDVLEFKRMEYKKIKYRKLKPKSFHPKTIKPKTLDFVFLRRGVIGVNEIGYVF